MQMQLKGMLEGKNDSNPFTCLGFPTHCHTREKGTHF